MQIPEKNPPVEVYAGFPDMSTASGLTAHPFPPQYGGSPVGRTAYPRYV